MTAEKKVAQTDKNGYKVFKWVKDRGRANEPLDCRNYAGAALVISKVNLERITELAPWLGSHVQNTAKPSVPTNKNRAITKSPLNTNKAVNGSE